MPSYVTDRSLIIETEIQPDHTSIISHEHNQEPDDPTPSSKQVDIFKS